MASVEQYSREAPFGGNAERALDLARAALLAQGFEIRESSSGRVLAISPGLRSTNQPALLGASTIAIDAGQGTLRLHAELGGVRRMTRFVWIFPLVMAAGFALTLGLIAGLVAGPWALGIVAVPFAPWIVLSPVLARHIRSRTVKALDALLASMQACG